MTASARTVLVLVLLVAAVIGYRWWNSPERQIRRTLEAVASRLSHDQPVNGLAAAAAAAALQEYLSPDVLVEMGRPFAPFRGRDIVSSSAARLLMTTPTMRVELVDVDIEVSGGGETARATCGVTATFTDRAGHEAVDARELRLELRAMQGRSRR